MIKEEDYLSRRGVCQIFSQSRIHRLQTGEARPKLAPAPKMVDVMKWEERSTSILTLESWTLLACPVDLPDWI